MNVIRPVRKTQYTLQVHYETQNHNCNDDEDDTDHCCTASWVQAMACHLMGIKMVL
jgi:hypothetical protein